MTRNLVQKESSMGRMQILCLATLLLAASPAPHVLAATPACEAAVAAASFPDAATLQAWNQVMADMSPRPTASPGHRAFIAWLRDRLREIPGLRLRSDRFSIRRQLERGATLSVDDGAGGQQSIATAGPVPYARLTGSAGVRAPLVHIAPGRTIASVDVRGKIVLRDHVASSIPWAVVGAVAQFFYDPGATLGSDTSYERDYLGYQGILTDLRAAAAGGAAGLVIVHEFPRAQVAGQYAPYEGVTWGVPALYLGVDEGRALEALADGTTPPTAVLRVTGDRRGASTRNLIATLPGAGPERIAIGSHTDGMNAIWDNGPIAMLALAQYFASLPLECRPRTFEFAFNSAHLYLAKHGAERYVHGLVKDCNNVALAVALEHLGARELIAVPRDDGPGRKLVASGFSEFLGWFVTPNPLLTAASSAQVTAYDLRRTGVLQFSPDVVSGEAGSFAARHLPTIGLIAGPWTLYDPSFGMEVVDFDLFRRQALAVRDTILSLQDQSVAALQAGVACTSE